MDVRSTNIAIRVWDLLDHLDWDGWEEVNSLNGDQRAFSSLGLSP